MFNCKYCNKFNDVDLLNVLIDQINLILEMLKESLKTNFENNSDIYERCLAIINLFKDIPCNYNQRPPGSQIDKETQYELEENSFYINAEEIKEVAGNFLNHSNFTFDERIGMYYDNSLCYYYDAEKSLYYDAYYGAYYLYDLNNNSFQFHSQIDPTKYSTIYHIVYESDVKQKNKKKTKHKKSNDESDVTNNVIMGDSQVNHIENSLNVDAKLEMTGTNVLNLDKINSPLFNDQVNDPSKASSRSLATVASEDLLTVNLPTNYDKNISSPDVEEGEITDDEQELATDSVPPELFNCVPCIRMIVKESSKLKINSLFIVTCTGATIGRETSLNHLILIPDPLISKMHCSINYRYDINRYVIQDHATQAGTFINGKRIGEAKCMSDHFKLYHDDELTIGSTVFCLHIHPRNDTCSSCEPGNLILKEQKLDEKIDIPMDRKTQLNNLKKKYGLKNSKYDVVKKFASTYVDRSQARRLRHASSNHTNVQSVNDNVAASVDRPIEVTNIGHRLLRNMGWNEGEGLGVNSEGIIEPVRTELRLNEVAGLGSSESCNISLDHIASADKKKNWLKTKQRFDRIDS